MKKIAVLIILTSLIGCKKEYTCEYGFYSLPINFSFIGFSANELDTIVIQKYLNNNGTKGSWIATDSIIQTAVMQGDTAYSKLQFLGQNIVDYTGFYSYPDGENDIFVELQVTSTEQKFALFNFKATENNIFTQNEPCTPQGGRTFLSVYSVDITGEHSRLYQPITNRNFIGLKKQ